ncbi:MAG: LacI family transcriptional regulator [Bacteroidetes bacterium]|nr:LacI family transcriptional regulator [Bacteroidota bacterium]
MRKKVTIKDIARELKISYSTVSRALNNKGKVNLKKRKSIQMKAKEMGYQPNSVAKQLRQGYSNTIGLIVPRINRRFFSNVINGVETIAKQKGYNVIICQSNEKLSEEIAGIETFINSHVAGVIMSLSTESNIFEAHQKILQRNIPFVMFDRVIQEINTNKVLNDNLNGAYKAVSHLIQQGYKKIIHFTGPDYLDLYKERSEGYKKALHEHGIEVDGNLIFKDVLTQKKGSEIAADLVKNKISFDAIFSASDFSALGAYTTLQQSGISIPEEVGIVGFANEPFTELIGLSSVEQYSSEIGRSAARLLFEEIEQKQKSESTKDITVKTELLIRKSSLKNPTL